MRPLPWVLIALGLVMALLAGCNGSVTSTPKALTIDAVLAKNYLTAADLTPGNVETVAAKDSDALKGIIASLYDLYATPQTSPAETSCTTTEIKTLKAVVGTGFIYFIGSGNLAACAKDAASNITSGTYKVFSAFTCPGVNFQQFQTSTFGDGANVWKACASATSGSFVLASIITWNMKNTDGSVMTFQLTSTRSLANGQPCQMTIAASAATISSCFSMHKLAVLKIVDSAGKVTLTPDKNYTMTYAQLNWENLIRELTGTPTYYHSGSMGLVINNWKGTVTYIDKDSVPTWALSDGTNTVSGQVQPASAASSTPTTTPTATPAASALH